MFSSQRPDRLELVALRIRAQARLTLLAVATLMVAVILVMLA